MKVVAAKPYGARYRHIDGFVTFDSHTISPFPRVPCRGGQAGDPGWFQQIGAESN
jgi:hypothetical protein